MALPQMLSADALARFRTKHCERVLVAGKCAFEDKCQYSHDTAWLRRNPRKHNYSPQFCADHKRGCCSRGVNCQFAHSQDEELYHPSAYKRAICKGGATCGGYYCPFAHGDVEIPKAARGSPGNAAMTNSHRRRGAQQCRQCAIDVTGSGSGALTTADMGRGVRQSAIKAEDESSNCWWHVDEHLQVQTASREQAGQDTHAVDDALSGPRGGRIAHGMLKQKGSDNARPCLVKLVPAGRREYMEAAQVVKEIKRWMTVSGRSKLWEKGDGAASRQKRVQRALEVRRTVATIYLALPEDQSYLVRSMDAIKENAQGTLAKRILTDWRIMGQVASWVQELVNDVATMHAEGIAHMCIAPSTVVVGYDGKLRLGDFLGKIRTLHMLANGNGTSDQKWAMWNPAEVQLKAEGADGADGTALTGVSKNTHQGAEKNSDSLSIDEFAVDAWQLGVTIFYMLTGEHPFGDVQKPAAVCENIVNDRPVNLVLLNQLPLFRHLLALLVARQPESRAPPSDLLVSHPIFWTLADTVERAASLSLKATSASLPRLSPATVMKNLPCLASFGSANPPSDTLARHLLHAIVAPGVKPESKNVRYESLRDVPVTGASSHRLQESLQGNSLSTVEPVHVQMISPVSECQVSLFQPIPGEPVRIPVPFTSKCEHRQTGSLPKTAYWDYSSEEHAWPSNAQLWMPYWNQMQSPVHEVCYSSPGEHGARADESLFHTNPSKFLFEKRIFTSI
mmetsp:Transcript_17243/g.29927  ORF Transcript_17243/g.29927 Transcript_17243/m.29927 type:complete len:734 (-) Transcript_17243:226-2427(-)